MRIWGINGGGIAVNGQKRITLAVEINDGQQFTGDTITVVIEKSLFDDLQIKFNDTSERARKMQLEIDTRWAPALKKAQHERDVFQHELMEKHEQMVQRVDHWKRAFAGAVKDLKEAHALYEANHG